MLSKDKALAEAAALWVLQKSSERSWGRGRMTAPEECKQVMVLLNESITAGACQVQACDVLGLSERTLQRWQTGETVHCDQRPKRDFQPPHKLTESERADVLAIANSDKFGHLPPSQIVPRLADQGRYIASESTFYRLLRAANQLTGLEWSQIDMQNKIAWIHADQSKNGKPIRIPLNDDALLVLRQQIGSHQCRVFTYEGKPIGKVSTKFFRTALIRAGIEGFCWHGLRHTWASWHVQAGTPLNVLQELGGWSDYKMVLRYAHLAPEHLSEYANRLTGIVAKFGCGR